MSTETMTPADELRAAAEKVAEATEPIAFAELGVADIRPLLADWLVAVGDDMDDEHAWVVDHPEWIGLAEDLRWGVHAEYGAKKTDSETWKTALLTARAINGGAA